VRAILRILCFPHKCYYGLLVWLSIYFQPLPSIAAEPAGTNLPPPNAAGGSSFTDSFVYLTSREFILSLLVIIFGVATLGVEYALIRNKPFGSTDVFKILAVSLIVVGTLFLTTAGFSSQQIAPAMGLFGTIAGYLLGRSSHKNDHDRPRQDE
jgi:hypothetical protein